MFSKDNSSIQSSAGKKGKDTPLRKSDRRNLRERVGTILQIANHHHDDDAARLDVVFLQGILCSRPLLLATNEKAVLYVRSPSTDVQYSNDNDTNQHIWPYTENAQIVWIEIDHGPHQGRTQLPTLALLSVLPSFLVPNHTPRLPLVSVPYQVSKYLCRGAHLMKSGMRRLVPTEKSYHSDATTRGTEQPRVVVAVVVEENPQPMAVGWLDPSVAAQQSPSLGPGHKGIGVHIVTAYGDDLWRQQQRPAQKGSAPVIVSMMGATYNEGNYGNIGFVDGKYVVPLVMDGLPDLEDEQEQKIIETEDEDYENEQEEKRVEDCPRNVQGVQDSCHDEKEVPGESDTVPDDEASDQAPTDMDVKLHDKQKQAVPNDEELLHEAVCKALVRLAPKKDLPMTVSVFYAQHVLKNRRPGTEIQLKRTRHKKFGNYLSEQIESGLLVVGPDAAKRDPMAMLVDYNHRHTDLRPYLQEAKEEKQKALQTENTRLVLLNLFAVPNHFVDLLRLDQDAVKAANATSEQRRNSGLLTTQETKAILDNYIAREDLVHPQHRSKVVLDGPLTDALFKIKGKEVPQSPPTEIGRKELADAWQAKMQPAFALVQMPGSAIVSMGRGAGPTVTVEVTKRNNKKFITKIRGMEDFGIVGTDFQREIAHRFACAASLDDDPHQKLKQGHVELVLQGNLADEVEALLTGDESLTQHGGAKNSPYRIPKNAIQVILRKGVPARKKKG